MSKKSAGILLYRFRNNIPEVLLVHPGGPYWAKKNIGTWSIPKGEFDDNELALDAAIREIEEETGIKAATLSALIELTPIRQKSGKVVFAWAAKGDFNTSEIKSNTFEIEWPPKSGEIKSFPEIDKAEWFEMNEAKERIIPGQIPLINELDSILKK